jgi:hypothetical protein
MSAVTEVQKVRTGDGEVRIGPAVTAAKAGAS